jgi:hypothetical protein
LLLLIPVGWQVRPDRFHVRCADRLLQEDTPKEPSIYIHIHIHIYIYIYIHIYIYLYIYISIYVYIYIWNICIMDHILYVYANTNTVYISLGRQLLPLVPAGWQMRPDCFHVCCADCGLRKTTAQPL